MTVLRFLFFSFVYGSLFYVVGLLVFTPIMVVIEIVWPQQGQPGVVKTIVGIMMFSWMLVGTPVLTFQVAKRRATIEPSLKQALMSTYFDVRLFLSTLPIIGPMFYRQPDDESGADEPGFEPIRNESIEPK